MFSSEQILQISGNMSQLEMAISFAISMWHSDVDRLSYQITEDGKYCIGWTEGNGWELLPFDFEANILSNIIKQHLIKQKIDNPYTGYDGTSSKGFLMKAIPDSFSDTLYGIKCPFYGIVSIEPYYNFYAK